MAGILVIWRLKPYPSLALLGRLCLAPRGGRRLPPFGGLPQGWKERLNLGKEMWMVLNSGLPHLSQFHTSHTSSPCHTPPHRHVACFHGNSLNPIKSTILVT